MTATGDRSARPTSVRDRVAKRRRRLAEDGLKEASSVIVPAHLEDKLREIARRWTKKHLADRRRTTGTPDA